jgi:hypothetical protein
MTFQQSLKKLPIQQIGHKLHIYDWEYNPKTCIGINRKTKEMWKGSWHELLIQKYWHEEMLI